MITHYLTMDELKGMEPGEIIVTGYGKYPGIHSEPIRWLAIKGGGWDDWAIYFGVDNPDWSNERIRKEGDKVMSDANIQMLVPCSAEVLERYRK